MNLKELTNALESYDSASRAMTDINIQIAGIREKSDYADTVREGNESQLLNLKNELTELLAEQAILVVDSKSHMNKQNNYNDTISNNEKMVIVITEIQHLKIILGCIQEEVVSIIESELTPLQQRLKSLTNTASPEYSKDDLGVCIRISTHLKNARFGNASSNVKPIQWLDRELTKQKVPEEKHELYRNLIELPEST